jgi:hypothetical protein
MSLINQLKKSMLDKKMQKYSIYEEIYINIINNNEINPKNSYITYKFKKFEYGLPLYNINECMNYVIEKIKKHKLKIGLINNYEIIISWYHLTEQNNNNNYNHNNVINNHNNVPLIDRTTINNSKKQFQELLRADEDYINHNSKYGNILHHVNNNNNIPRLNYNPQYNKQQIIAKQRSTELDTLLSDLDNFKL